jgi:Tfp pilus assembly protein PilF
MNIDSFSKAMQTKPEDRDTERTLGWKVLVESAKTCHKKGDFENAAKMFDQALTMAELRLGAKHIVLAHILMQYSEVCEETKDFEKARALSSRARVILGQLASDSEGSVS